MPEGSRAARKPRASSEHQNEPYALEDVTGEYQSYLFKAAVLNCYLNTPFYAAMMLEGDLLWL
jgi:hypothetical protein